MGMQIIKKYKKLKNEPLVFRFWVDLKVVYAWLFVILLVRKCTIAE